VRDVRLLVELDTGANSVELATTPESPDMSRGVSPAVDGELATPWTPFPTGAPPGTRSTLTLALDRAVEPVSLGIVLKSVPSGSIQVQAIDDLGGVRTLAARGGAELRGDGTSSPSIPELRQRSSGSFSRREPPAAGSRSRSCRWEAASAGAPSRRR
jgi:hypothetical protein